MQGGRVIYRSGMGIGGWRDGDRGDVGWGYKLRQLHKFRIAGNGGGE